MSTPTKQHIIVVEDDTDISRLVAHHLETNGFRVKSFASAEQVIESALEDRPALFLLDIMLPRTSGLQLCEQIRREPLLALVPIVFLTAKSSETDRVAGLELGADDYIVKPFSPRELVARVRAILRRFERPLVQGPLTYDSVEMDTTAMTVTVRGKRVSTTATEFRLLEFFLQHIGRVFTRDQLLVAVWRDHCYVTPRSVDVYERRLHEKIEREADTPKLLQTVRGAGYRFGEHG